MLTLKLFYTFQYEYVFPFPLKAGKPTRESTVTQAVTPL